jgi:hypothetical protein
MNKGSCIVLLVALFVVLGGTAVCAQSPNDSNWKALGCDEIWSKSRARMSMTKEQLAHVAPFTEDEAERFDWSRRARLTASPTLTSSATTPPAK